MSESNVTTIICPPTDQCKCNCPESCEHQWDGPEISERQPGGGVMQSVTCSRCGVDAFSHDIRVAP